LSYFRALITIGILETDPGNTRRKRVNFRKGRTLTKWYKSGSIAQALTLVGKTKFAKVRKIDTIDYKSYIKGVEKHHEY